MVQHSDPNAPQHPSLWVREAARLADDAAPLPERTDVVVIGGGIGGVSAALWLAREGVEVVLLEAEEIASRASGRNDGQVLLGLGEHYNRIVSQFGRDDARRLWRSIQHNHDLFEQEIEAGGLTDCELQVAGGLRLSETPHEQQELLEAADLLTADGIDHELWDVDRLATEFPAAKRFHGALRLPGEAIVQPAAMVRGLARRAREAGARIVEHTPVRGVRDGHGDGWQLTLDDGRTLAATIVVHATSALAGQLDASGFLSRQLFAFRGQIVASEPLPAELRDQFPQYAMSSNFCYEYFRMHGDRFVVGGMRWSVRGEQLGLTDDSGHDDRISANLIRYAREHFPTLADVPFPVVWTGIIAGTRDGLPLVGAIPGRTGAFALCGFNGYGLSFAFLAGKSLAEQVVHGRAKDPAAGMFAPRRLD